MKTKNILISLFIILTMVNIISLVSAVDIKMESYYPMPVEAGDYFDIKLKVISRTGTTSDVGVKFDPEYPFSLDPGIEETVVINSLGPSDSALVNFRIRTDPGAKEGDNLLSFSYKDCPGCVWSKAARPYSIVIKEAVTKFDVVLQELTSDKVIIGVANIGKNPANAVIVNIPEQEHFKTMSISSSIVGNLESGDYTLVGFQIVPKSEGSLSGSEEELLVEVEYTDPLGGRKSTSKTISLDSKLLNQARLQNVSEDKKENFYSDGWFMATIVLIVFIIGNALYRNLRGKK